MSKAGRRPAKQLFEDGTYNIDHFHEVFIKCEDITEYRAAIELMGDWRMWEQLKSDWPTFKNVHIRMWVEELEVIFKSRAIDQVLTASKKGNFNASRWIAEEGFNKKAGAGRPSNAQKKRAAKDIAEASAETVQEKARILKMVSK